MTEMNYQEAKEYVAHAGKNGAIELGLDHIRELCRRLGTPQDELKFIHIAGTNGKGSVLAYIFTVLMESGYRVGRYISPTLFSYRERIQVNEEYISREDFTRLANRIARVIEEMKADGLPSPSPFEIETAISFLYFKEQKCDVVVLETGMGGLEDATNIITTSVMEILVTVSRDHMGFLGNTLAEIATQKAGIIKPSTCVVTAHQEEEALGVIQEKCCKENAILYEVQDEDMSDVQYGLKEQRFLWHTKEGDQEITIHLSGSYQIENAKTALTALRHMKEVGFPVSVSAVKKGMARTQWRGRFTLLKEEPILLMDGAHNEDGARMLCRSLKQYFSGKRIYYIVGMLADKEYEKVAAMTAPYACEVLTVETPDNPRALSSEDLAKVWKQYHSHVEACTSIKQAVTKALQRAGKEEVIVAFGSLSFLGLLEKCVRDLPENIKNE